MPPPAVQIEEPECHEPHRYKQETRQGQVASIGQRKVESKKPSQNKGVENQYRLENVDEEGPPMEYKLGQTSKIFTFYEGFVAHGIIRSAGGRQMQ